MHNVHQRTIEASAELVGALLDQLGGPEDRLWPSPAWPPMVLDRPLQVGSDGGHGPIRYHVTAHEPGRRVRFAFHPETGIVGTHELAVTPAGPQRCVLRHHLTGEAVGLMRLLVPLAVEGMHDALLEDLLDNAERASTGTVRHPARWSRWVRLLHLLTEGDHVRGAAIPEAARLARAAFDRADLADAWRTDLRPGHPTDPQAWAGAAFRDPPAWVLALLVLRNLLVPVIGVERGDRHAFATLARTDAEVLLGTDAGHLDLRASVLVADGSVMLSTVARCRTRTGRAYLGVVRSAHPVVVRAMLRRASRRLALRHGQDPRVPR